MSYDIDKAASFTVVYVVDGNMLFDMTAGILRGMNLNIECPPAIVVAIGYDMDGGFDFREFPQRRSNDLTSVVDERYEDVLVNGPPQVTGPVAIGRPAAIRSHKVKRPAGVRGALACTTSLLWLL